MVSLLHHASAPAFFQIRIFPTTTMKSLLFFSIIPSTLALVAPLERLKPNVYKRDAHWGTKSWSHGPDTATITVTTTLIVTINAIPTDDGAFPNTTTTETSVTATSGDGLAPTTLIMQPSEASTPQETSDILAPITLIDLSTAFSLSTATGDADGAAPTPNDIEPITLIDISTATPI